jgi:hypothetical protein
MDVMDIGIIFEKITNSLFLNRPRTNIILRPKVFLAKESTQIKMILIASYFFSEIELATIDIHPSYRTI